MHPVLKEEQPVMTISKVSSDPVGALCDVSERTTDETSNRRLRRKIDLSLLPFMMFTQVLQNTDASALGYTAVWGLQDDLGISASQYTWIASVLYFGFLTGQYPMALAAQRWHTGRVVGIVIVLWGICMLAGALCTNFAGMMAQRFFLGMLSSIIGPAWVLLTSIFYLREEQTFRILLWWSMNGLSLAFGGLISFSCGYIKVNNIPSWKWIYIINGTITVMWGVVVYLWVPSSPQTARWLSSQEREQAVQRLASNKTGTKNSHIKKYQIAEALNPLKDPQGCLIVAILFFNEFINGGFGAFYGLIIQSFGYGALQTSLMGIALGFTMIFWMVGSGAMTLRFKNLRIIMAMIILVPSFIGFVLQVALPGDSYGGAKAFGCCMALAYAATCVLVAQLPAQNAGGYTKRTTLTSMAFLGTSSGNIVGPHVFYDGQTPLYLTGYIADLTCFAIQWVLLGTLLWWYKSQNRKRDELYGPPQAEADDALTDLTDRENLNFRCKFPKAECVLMGIAPPPRKDHGLA